MNFMRAAAAAIFSIAGLATSAAHAAPILNGDFSLGPADWAFTGNVGVANSTAYDLCCATGDTGTGNFAAFGGGNGPNTGQISQSFATDPGALYQLSFQYGAFSSPAGIGTQSLAISAGNLSTTLVSAISVRDLPSLFTTYTYQFTASGALTSLSFADASGANTNSIDGILDTVSVNAVPEPFTLSIFGAGLVGAAALRRRRRKSEA